MDEPQDVLYLAKAGPREVAGLHASQEGHRLRIDASGSLQGVTLVGPLGILEHEADRESLHDRGSLCTLSSVPSTVDLNLPDELLDSIDREIVAGRYRTREEFVRRAVQHLLALETTASTDESQSRQLVEPAEDWAGDSGLRLLEQASQRLPYSDDASE